MGVRLIQAKFDKREEEKGINQYLCLKILISRIF